MVSALVPVERLSFGELKKVIGTSDGNLATHARKLEDAGYVVATKAFVGRKPLTTYALTEAGRAAFSMYVAALQALLP